MSISANGELMKTISTRLFWARQLDQVKEERWVAIHRKLRIVLQLLSRRVSLDRLWLALPVVLIIRLLRPLVLIRLGVLRSTRIGHFAGNTEKYLCEHQAGTHPPRTFDVFYCSRIVCNDQLKRMWGRQLRIMPRSMLRRIDEANQMLPGGEAHRIVMPSNIDVHGYLSQFGTHLTFTPEEEVDGSHYLTSIGLRGDDKFICFCIRDSIYLDEMFPERSREEWSYHDYRDACVQDFVPAIESLVDTTEWYAFRLGKLVKNAFCSDNPKIIDYASNGDRSDFLDIYLAAKCHLFINSGSGFFDVPVIFRRNVVSVNLIPIGWPSGGHAFIPKKLWLKNEKRFLTFQEMSELPRRINHLDGWEYDRLGLEVIDNTANEISDFLVEVIERMNGTWIPQDEDHYLKERFQRIFPPPPSDSHGSAFIGARFLRENEGLLS